MKKTMLILVLLLVNFSNLLYSQCLEPQQRKLKYNGIDSIEFHSNLPPFLAPAKTYIGFHWQQNSEISKALFANQNNVKAVWMNYPYPITLLIHL
jgi:hypothetical protein